MHKCEIKESGYPRLIPDMRIGKRSAFVPVKEAEDEQVPCAAL